MKKQICVLVLLLGGCGSLDSSPSVPSRGNTVDETPVTSPTPETTVPKAGPLPADYHQLQSSPELTARDEELHQIQPAYHPAPAAFYEQGRQGQAAAKGVFMESFNRVNRQAGRPDFDIVAHYNAQKAAAEMGGAQ